MRILVVGAGATGGYFGGRLAQAGRDVTFLVRPARAAVLADRGLVIRSPGGRDVVGVRTVTAATLDGPYDLVLLSVKSYGLAAAVTDLGPAVGPATVIVPLLNGLRHLDTLTAAFGADRVYGGVCMIAGTLSPEGDIVQLTGLHRLAYGPLGTGPDPRLPAVTAALSGAFFDAEGTTEIVQRMWDKWLFLPALGVVTTLMRGPVGTVLAAPGGPAFVDRVVAEAVATVTAAGHPPSAAALALLHGSITNARDVPTTSSLYRDMQAGLPVEADTIVGDFVGYAQRLGVDVPLYAAAYTNLSSYAAGTVVVK